MMKKYKTLALTLCAAVMLSGCTENKTTSAASDATETSAPVVTTVSTAETSVTTESETTADSTTTAADPKNSEDSGTTETTVETTTTAAAAPEFDTFFSETKSEFIDATGSDSEKEQTTAQEAPETTPATTTSTVKTLEPPPEIDENMFTLYIGGNNKAEKYDVKVDSLPSDIVSELVKKLPNEIKTITVDKNGKYTLSDKSAMMSTDAAMIEKMLSKDYFDSMKPNLKGTEYENMTYEEFRKQMLDFLNEMYPEIKDMYDSDGNLNIKTEYGKYIEMSYIHPYKSQGAYTDETVIKEGIKAAFDSLEKNNEYKKTVDYAKKKNKTILMAIDISYNGGYKLEYRAGFYCDKESSSSNIEGSLYLGKAKIFEKAPDTLTRYVISTDSEILRDINTDDNPYEMSLDIVAHGYIADLINVRKSGYSNAMQNDAILGIIPEIEIGNLGKEQDDKLKEIRMYFKIKKPYLDNVIGSYAEKTPELKGIKRLNVFQFFDDINVTLPIETYFYVDKDIVYTVTGLCGTYCLYDMEKWLQMLDIEP